MSVNIKNKRAITKRWRKEHPEQKAIHDKKYRQTEKGKAAMKRQTVVHRKTYPNKYKAKTAVSNALRLHKLSKESCEFCGTIYNIEAHHHNYSQPLNVMWLCFQCHRMLHGVIK